MSEKARVLLIVAVILGLALAVSSCLGAEECPPPKLAVEIGAVMEVSNDVLWSVVNDGNITFDFGEDKAFLRIVAKSERVEARNEIDPEGNEVRLVGVFAEVFFRHITRRTEITRMSVRCEAREDILPEHLTDFLGRIK